MQRDRVVDLKGAVRSDTNRDQHINGPEVGFLAAIDV